MNLLATLAALALCQLPTGPADLAISGPTEGEVGTEVVLSVGGLPEVQLDATMGESLKWADHVEVLINAPEGDDGEFDSDLAISFKRGLTWKWRVTLNPDVVGAYVIIVDWNMAPYGLATHRLEVGGSGPNPPGPNPPGPVKPGRRHVTIVREPGSGGKSTSAQLSMYIALATDKDLQAKHVMEIHDPDEAPAAVIKALTGVQWPGCLILDDSDNVLFSGPAPTDYDAMMELIKRHGGQ